MLFQERGAVFRIEKLVTLGAGEILSADTLNRDLSDSNSTHIHGAISYPGPQAWFGVISEEESFAYTILQS